MLRSKKIKNPSKISQIIPTKLPWCEPIEIAQKISFNHAENWVFLYSALSATEKASKSYIALFESAKYRGNNLEELQEIIKKDRQNQMWFGGLNYEALGNCHNSFECAPNYVKTPQIFFSKFDLVLEFVHDQQHIVAYTNNPQLINKLFEFKYFNKKHSLSVKNINSNFSDDSYKKTIDDIKSMIARGDFYQANLTRKFFGEFDQKPSSQHNFNLFLDLTKASPANYSSFMKFEDVHIISSSPELFLYCRGNKIYSRPIKGTIKRGESAQEDERNRKYLKKSSKEKAENLMIVDLMRNDFARFCQPKSVKVSKLFKVSAYKTIFHLSSQISGKIADGFNAFDALKYCFPAGSMTGAPKIKVVEVLQNLERIERGIYSGALGYFDGQNGMNFAVVIRTLIIKNNKFEFQVGGGITFDSDPESELVETYSKAKAILQILKLPNFLMTN